jgi:hypothetical protein
MAAAVAPLAVAQEVAAADLPGFPDGAGLHRSAYRNWVGEISADGLWACAPSTPDQVVAVVNWARRTAGRYAPGVTPTAGRR